MLKPNAWSLLRLARVQRELLHAPVRNFTDVELIFVPAVDFVDRSEFLQLLAGLAELAEDLAIELHLVDFAVVIEITGTVGVRAVEVLVRARRDTHGPRRAYVEEHRFQSAIVVEHLNAAIAAIADVHVAPRIDRDRVHGIELAGTVAQRPPRLDEHTVLVELRHARVAV